MKQRVCEGSGTPPPCVFQSNLGRAGICLRCWKFVRVTGAGMCYRHKRVK